MPNFESQKYRDDLAKEIRQEPSKEKQREILSTAKSTAEYQEAKELRQKEEGSSSKNKNEQERFLDINNLKSLIENLEQQDTSGTDFESIKAEVGDGIIGLVEFGDDNLLEILPRAKKIFNLPDEFYYGKITEGLLFLLNGGGGMNFPYEGSTYHNNEYTFLLREKLLIPPKFFDPALESVCENRLKGGVSLHHFFLSSSISEDGERTEEMPPQAEYFIKKFKRSPSIRLAAREGILARLRNKDEYPEFALWINNEFGFSDDIWTSIWENELSQYKDSFFEFCKKNNLDLLVTDPYVMAGFFSGELSVELLESITRENPFLIDAIRKNKYGIRLFRKFPELDEASKNNIRKLYDLKNVICADEPSIDVEGVEFRKKIQGGLQVHARNQEILDCISDVTDSSVWLNYDTAEHFVLGSETHKFSDTIKTLSDRYVRTLESLIETTKIVLKEAQEDLKKSSVQEDISGLVAQLEEMRLLKAKVEAKDPKKAAGMSKAIKNLEEQISNPRKINGWQKVVGSLDRLRLLVKSFNKRFTDLSSIESRIDQQEITGQKEARKLLVQSFITVDEVVNGYFDELKTILTVAVSDEVATSLVEKVKRLLGHNIDHIKTDSDDLRKSFGKQTKDELTGRTMSISINSRNPDTALYLGNYTNCCVCIESDFHDDESPIADYVTDLGMQIVTAVDEQTKRPVVAAWCWIGIDPETKEAALVIDNIEADQGYVRKYHDQIKSKMETFLSDYARTLKLPLVQGPENNDLVVAPLSSIHIKVGGYNRPDGYFLEGERDIEEEEGEATQ